MIGKGWIEVTTATTINGVPKVAKRMININWINMVRGSSLFFKDIEECIDVTETYLELKDKIIEATK